MNQWKSKIEETKKSGYDDSVGDSSSSNPPLAQHKKVDHSSGSYESDDFEDVSASGSGSRSKMNVWQPKGTPAAIETKNSAAAANDYNPNAMEEYLKK